MGKKKNVNSDNYVKYTYKDRTPKELSKKAKVILGVILAILVIATGYLGYELKTTTIIKENAIAYQEYNPDFDYENEELEETSGWASITAENLEPYREITSNIQKEKEEKEKKEEESNSNSNEQDDKGKAPVITKLDLATTGTAITATAVVKDEDTPAKNLTIVYSINAGKTWQKSNTFTGLKLNTAYTVSVKVTDDKGNSATKNAKIKTPAAAKANVTGVYKNGGSVIYIYQVTTGTIIYSIGTPTMKSTHRTTLASNANGVKTFGAGLKFNSVNLIYNGKTYTYSSNVDTDEMFKSYYGGYLDATSPYNGYYESLTTKGYKMDIVPIRNGAVQKLYVYMSGGGKSTMVVVNLTGSKFSYNAGGEAISGQFYRGNVKITSSSTKGSVLATASGDYARYKTYTMETAIVSKVGL